MLSCLSINVKSCSRKTLNHSLILLLIVKYWPDFVSRLVPCISVLVCELLRNLSVCRALCVIIISVCLSISFTVDNLSSVLTEHRNARAASLTVNSVLFIARARWHCQGSVVRLRAIVPAAQHQSSSSHVI